MKRILIFASVLVLLMGPRGFANNIKEANVSGQFYDADPARLSKAIHGYLDQAQIAPSDKDIPILISPHAGYPYSGPVAAYGYKSISRKSYKTVVILAPSHFYGFDSASVWKEGGFKTPLGVAEVDADFARQLMEADSQLVSDPRAFDREHSLEVQIPFLQTVLKDFKIVPIVMGQCTQGSAEKLADALNTVIGERQDVLVVVSSDMSHYFPAKIADQLDFATLTAIQKMDIPGYWEKGGHQAQGMCGYVPVATALFMAQKRGLKPELLKHAHSGDTSGDNSRVVGYASVVFSPGGPQQSESRPEQPKIAAPTIPPLSKEQKKQLIGIARRTIEDYVREGKVFDPQVNDDPRLAELEGAFVTLKRNGQLRGCIGRITGVGSLYLTVRDMAIAAASEDPRFNPVSAGELKDIELEISVLSKPRYIRDPNEVQPGVHGVIISRGFRSGVFLPQVATEWGWGREELLSNLCSHKAGLPPDAWKDPQTRIQIFTADVFSEKDVH